MNVNDFDKNISNYLDGDLSLSDIEDFERLLRDNFECKEKLESYKIMLDELSNLEFLNTSDKFLNKLHQKIDILSQVTSSQNIEKINYNYIPIISVAAGIAIFIFSISIFMDSNHDDDTTNTEIQLHQAGYEREE